jgi:hypothetical protein
MATKPLPHEITDALGNHYPQRPAESEFYDGLGLAIEVVKAIGGHEARTDDEKELITLIVGTLQQLGGERLKRKKPRQPGPAGRHKAMLMRGQ